MMESVNLDNNLAARRRKGCKVIANCEHPNEKHYAKVRDIEVGK